MIGSQHLLDERAPVKRLKFIEFLAGADEPCGNAEFILNRNHHAAFAAAVELGDDDAR